MDEEGVRPRIMDAMVRERNDDLDGAIAIVDDLVDGHPLCVAVLLLAGQLHLAAAKRPGEQREQHLERATSLLSSARADPLGQNNLGVARIHAHVLLEANKMKEAEAEIARALSLRDPDDPDDFCFHVDTVKYDVNYVFPPDTRDRNDANEDPTQKMKRNLRVFRDDKVRMIPADHSLMFLQFIV